MANAGTNGIDRRQETDAVGNAATVPEREVVLRAEDVRRQYGETVALDGVSLAVGAGEVVCLIGPNGAGKTTLVRALCGTTDFEGRVTAFGSAPAAVDRSRVGLLPQEFAPPARLSARELLTYYAGLYDDPREVGSVLSELGLTDAADTRYENLSGGQRRRVCVGTALVNDPELLFLDEPTTGIDPAGRRSLWTSLETLAAGGTTIFLTTHDMAEAERLADRVGLLADGRLVAVDSPSNLVAAHGGENTLRVDPTSESERERAECTLRAAGYRIETSEAEPAVVVREVSPEAIGGVVAELETAAIAYEGLEWRQPTLEDAYLSLTGVAVGAGGTPIDAREGNEPGRSTGRIDTESVSGADSYDSGDVSVNDGEGERLPEPDARPGGRGERR